MGDGLRGRLPILIPTLVTAKMPPMTSARLAATTARPIQSTPLVCARGAPHPIRLQFTKAMLVLCVLDRHPARGVFVGLLGGRQLRFSHSASCCGACLRSK